MKMSEPFVLNQDNRSFISSTLYHPSISLEEKPAHVSSTYSHSEFSRDSDPYPEMDLSTSSKPDRNDDTTPIDLSIKRPSVITACNYQDSTSERDQTVRPSHLPIPKKIVTEISKPKSPTAPTTPIRENAKDILSPVTESSLLLKSIYDTTYRVSSSNFEKNSQADPMKDTSCGPMLQTYLTERAVLDSTRKRYQYLHTSVEDQSLNNDQNYSIVYSSHQYSGSSAGTKSYTSSASYHSTSQTLVVSSASGTACLVPITSSSYEPGPCYAAVSSSTSVSSSDKLVNVSQSVATSQASVSQASKSFSTIPISQKSESQIVSSSSVATAITTSSKTSDARINRPGRKSGKAGSGSSLFNTSSPMPTSPANLTVINNCSGDTKTAAFIAPSGVMPSSHNNKLGSDDGKCKCNVCHKEFAKQGQLRLHINIHYIERPHRCESCGISFRTNGHLQKHKRSVSHFNKVNMNMTFGTPSTDNPRPFKCHDCKIAFRIYGHLAKHLRSKLHIMKLECLGKLPFGTYAEIERSGGNLNEIDTSDCENSLESLQLMASKLYEKEPAKLLAWQSQQQQAQQQKLGTERERTISNSSNNSEEYSLIDDQECGTPSSASTGKSNGEESDEDDPPEVKTSDAFHITVQTHSLVQCSLRNGSRQSCICSPESVLLLSSYKQATHAAHPFTNECGQMSFTGATEGLIGCPKCHKKFLDLKAYEVHHLNEHEKLNSNEVDDENVRSKLNESQGSPNTSSSPGIVGVEASSRSPLPQQGNSGTMIDSHQEEDCQL
ncbi:Transcription factor E4F1 [Armadillidium vulgare]|nr:Transcription factor E4F1 [Armadillidium vulgare]